LYRGNYELAERMFREVLEQSPKDPASYNNLGYLAVAEYDPQRALGFFKRAAEVTPGMLADWLLLNTSFAYLELGDYDGAIESIERTLAISPHFDIAFGVAALAYALKGNTAAAKVWAEKAKAAHVLPADVVGFPVGSEAYERWSKRVLLPTWRALGLPE
jgi:tetratricopeptide (TPR) repeat protein